MKINGNYTFPANAETVWDLLLDPQVLLQVIPGLESVDVKPDGNILATAMIGVGPVKGRFTGTLHLLDQQRPTHVRVTGEGKGGPNIVELKVGQFFDDFDLRKAGGQQVEHVHHADAKSADAGSAAKLVGF